ncbi:MAG: ABC transporter permease [Clostridia bacterium]|jgi:lantibiotic ABC superfamily ATP binding cassette transporter, membrane protein
MLGKLSVRNAKRQAKDYIIYFITVIISVALMFSFNSIAVSEDISELSTYMKDFGKAILGISVIIIFVMAWLINYTMKFMLEKRSKEFGTYQILGIEKKDISNMFTLENILIGSLAFVLGVGAGLFLNQFLTSIIMNLFNQPYQIQIVFDIKAVGLTALYFFGIFVLVLLNCRRKIKKTKVYNLLYADKKNENNVIKKSKGNIIVFITSLVLLLLAYFINDREFSNMSNMTGRNIFIALVMLIIGIYLFYISISSFIVKRYLQNKSRKYKKSNMFLYRNLTSKINTMSITMGTIALMFTFILVGGNVALLMNNMLNNEIEMGYPFEITMSSLDKDFSIYKDYINKNAKVKEMYEYDLYDVHNTNIRRALDGSAFESRYYYDTDSVMLLKDYNKLRQMLGYEQVSLGENEAIIHSMKTAEEKFEKYIEKNNSIEICNKKLTIKQVNGESISQISFNGYTYCIVVPDYMEQLLLNEQIETRKDGDLIYNHKLAVTTEEITTQDFARGLEELIPREEFTITSEYGGERYEQSIERGLAYFHTKGERLSEAKSFYAIISFLAFYVALIFVMATATLLAIQQLSDSEKYKYRYELLKKLGMDELEINRTIFKQLFFYFAIPMLLPFILSIPIILSISKIFTIAVTIEEIIRNIGIIYGMFILVYGIYFIATDVQFTRNIEEIR